MRKDTFVQLTNRKAQIALGGDWDLQDDLNELLKFRRPGWDYTYAAKYNGWDGYEPVVSASGVMGAGLFLAMREKIEEELGVKFKVRDAREEPSMRGLSVLSYREFEDRGYQIDCIRKMIENRKTGGLILNATGCVDGDTFIDCPRDLSKYPLGIPIRALVGKKPWVYGWCDKKRRISLAKASRVWKSGTGVPVYRVTFKTRGWAHGSRKRRQEPIDYIVATADHPFLLYKQKFGSVTNAGHDYEGCGFVELKDLRVGDRVMALHRSIGSVAEGYSNIFLNDGTGSVLENRFIATEVFGDRPSGWHAHHKNEKKLDNNVGNLKWKRHSDHARHHALKRRASGEFIGWEKTGIHPRGMLGKKQTEYQKRIARAKWNHVVKKIEFVGYRDVYNMTVPSMQNFVANGVVTHNTGKTYIAGRYFATMAGPALFLVDELTLLKQAKQELESVLNEKVGEIGNSIWKTERITVGTIQTVHRHRFDPQYVKWTRSLDCIVIDEVHLALNRRNFETIKAIKPPTIFGLTATLELKKKHVAMRSYELCGPVLFEYPLKQGVEEGVLSKGIAVAVQVENEQEQDEPYSERKSATWWMRRKHFRERYVIEYPRFIVEGQKRNKVIVDLVTEAYRKGKHIVVLVERVQHLKNLSSLLKVPHHLVFGEKKVEERRDSQQMFEKEHVRVILSNKVFKKGINIKRIDVMIDGAAMKSKNDAQQKYGRGVRLCDGKTGLIYFDIADVGNRFEKAAKSRRTALKRNGIPVYLASSDLGSAKLLALAEKRLAETAGEIKENQRELFKKEA